MKNLLAGFKFLSGSAPHLVPRLVSEAIALLDAEPRGNVLNLRELAARLGRTVETMGHAASDPALSAYRTQLKGRTYWWGSKRTILELKRCWAEEKRKARNAN